MLAKVSTTFISGDDSTANYVTTLVRYQLFLIKSKLDTVTTSEIALELKCCEIRCVIQNYYQSRVVFNRTR